MPASVQQPPKVMSVGGADAAAAVTIAGSVNHSVICESLVINGGIVFRDNDD